MKRPLLIGVLLVLLALVTTSFAQETTEIEVLGSDSYPENINPLTGLPTENPDNLNRRPLLIKISNYPPLVREFQRGLNDAEIVWEHLLAGGVTRFSAIFLENDYEQIGPIRSGRLVDFELTRIYRSLFTYSGMSQGTYDILRGDALMWSRVVGGSGPCPPLCRDEHEGVALEHTLYGNTSGLRELAIEREADIEPDPIYGMAFSEQPLQEGAPLERMAVRYRETVIEWVWDDESERWFRWQDEEEHFDSATETQISAANVVVLEDGHTIQPFVEDQYWGPPNFAFSVNFIGAGRIFFMRDGMVYEGVWVRETREEPLRFFDADGNVLAFHPGNTFFNLVPRWIDGYEIEVVLEETPMATVNGDTGVLMRYGPNEQYISPDVAYPLDEFRIIGRDYDGDWLQLKRNGERAIWLPLERLTVPEDLDIIYDLPHARATNER